MSNDIITSLPSEAQRSSVCRSNAPFGPAHSRLDHISPKIIRGFRPSSRYQRSLLFLSLSSPQAWLSPLAGLDMIPTAHQANFVVPLMVSAESTLPCHADISVSIRGPLVPAELVSTLPLSAAEPSPFSTTLDFTNHVAALTRSSMPQLCWCQSLSQTSAQSTPWGSS